MALSPAETAAQRRVTAAYIAADPDTVVLTPYNKTSNGSGGFVVSASPARPPQSFRLIAVNGQTEERTTLDGVILHPGFMLMGAHDAEVARGDRFVVDGMRLEVVHVQEKRDYQTKCEVAYLGTA